MQGYVLPLAVAILLAAPVVWRLDNDVLKGPAAPAEGQVRSVAPPSSLTSFTSEVGAPAPAEPTSPESEPAAFAVPSERPGN